MCVFTTLSAISTNDLGTRNTRVQFKSNSVRVMCDAQINLRFGQCLSLVSPVLLARKFKKRKGKMAQGSDRRGVKSDSVCTYDIRDN